MDRIITYTIKNTENSLRVEQFLRRHGYSYQNLTQLKKMPESTLINGTWAYMKELLTEGDTLTCLLYTSDAADEL